MFYPYVCCTPCACRVLLEVRTGSQIPWNWSYRQLWATMWVLELEPGCSTSVLNSWAISPVHSTCADAQYHRPSSKENQCLTRWYLTSIRMTKNRKSVTSQFWWQSSVIPALGRQTGISELEAVQQNLVTTPKSKHWELWVSVRHLLWRKKATPSTAHSAEERETVCMCRSENGVSPAARVTVSVRCAASSTWMCTAPLTVHKGRRVNKWGVDCFPTKRGRIRCILQTSQTLGLVKEANDKGWVDSQSCVRRLHSI